MPSDLSLTPELFAKYLKGQDELVKELAFARTARERIGPKPTPFRTLLRLVGDEYRVPNGIIRHIGISTPAFFQTVFTLVDATSGQLLYTGNTAAGSQLLPGDVSPGTLLPTTLLQHAEAGCDGVTVTQVAFPLGATFNGNHVMIVAASASVDPSNMITSIANNGYPLLTSTTGQVPNLYVFYGPSTQGQVVLTGNSGVNDGCSIIIMEFTGGALENTQSAHAQGGAHAYPVIPTAQSLPFTVYAHGNVVGADFGHDQSPYALLTAPVGAGAYASVSYGQAGNVAPLPATGQDGMLAGATFKSYVPYYSPDVVISVSSMQATSQLVFIPFQGGIRLASFAGLPISLTGANDYPIIVCGETST